MSSGQFSTTLNDTGIPFVHPAGILAVAIILPLLGIITVSLRFWMRHSGGVGIGLDDWSILAALPLTIAMAAMMIYGVAEHAVGYPSGPYPVPKPTLAEEVLFETTPEQTVVFIVYWTTWLLLIPANGLIKISALFMYRRVFVTRSWTTIDIILKFMFVVCLLWTVGFFFAQLFGCGTAFYKPFGSLADVASCHTNARLNALVISDLITDILVWIIPFPLVWKLKMSVTNKLSVTAVLLLVTLSIVAAAIRLKVELGIASGGYSIHVDGDQALTINIFWSNIESSLALVAACLPALRLRTFYQRVGSAVRSLRDLLSTQRSDHSTTRLDSHNNQAASLESLSANNTSRKHTYDNYELGRVATIGQEVI